mgnify:CR=1 FL=1
MAETCENCGCVKECPICDVIQDAKIARSLTTEIEAQLMSQLEAKGKMLENVSMLLLRLCRMTERPDMKPHLSNFVEQSYAFLHNNNLLGSPLRESEKAVNEGFDHGRRLVFQKDEKERP